MYHRARRLNVKRIAICAVAFVCILGLIVYGAASLIRNNSKDVQVAAGSKNVKVSVSAQENETKTENNKKINNNVKPETVSIIAVGDNLVSDSVLYTAQRNGGGKYDFSSVFEKMKPDFKKADLAIINQETMLGGKNYLIRDFHCLTLPTQWGMLLLMQDLI